MVYVSHLCDPTFRKTLYYIVHMKCKEPRGSENVRADPEWG